jgi:hypothetical protein
MIAKVLGALLVAISLMFLPTLGESREQKTFTKEQIVALLSSPNKSLAPRSLIQKVWSSCGGWSTGDCDSCSKRETATSACTRCNSCGSTCGSYVC